MYLSKLKFWRRDLWKTGRHGSASSSQTTPALSDASPPASSGNKPETQSPITNTEPHGPVTQSTNAADATVVASLPEATADKPDPPRLSARLWTQAWDAIRNDNPKVAEAYEAVLQSELKNESNPINSDNSHENNAQQAQAYLVLLIKSGLEKTESEAVVKQNIQEGIRVVSSVKDFVGTAVKYAPEAATAWAGVCLLLQVRDHGIMDISSNRFRFLKTLWLRQLHIATVFNTFYYA